MPASKEHRLFKRLLPFLVGISLFAFAVLPAEANAGFFDSILGTPKSSYKGATPTPKPSPKVKSVAQKQKSPRPQVARKIDLPSIQLPKLNIGKTLASIGDALWPFDDVTLGKAQAKDTQSKPSFAKASKGKQVGQVLGEKDSKGPGLLSKFFKGVGNVVAGVLDFLWPFDGDGQKGLAKKDDKGKAAVSPGPAGATQPKAGAEVVTELAQTGEEDSSSALVAIPEEVAKLTITEKLTVGDDSSDRLILKALLGSDILVDTTKTYNLGSGSGRFKDGYFSNNIYVGEENRIGATGMNVKGPMYLETRSGGSLYLLPDSQNVYIGTDTQTGHLTVANNLTVKGTLSTTSGAGLTPDSLDITPATNIDALDIIGTNITTASLIDLDPTGTTSGNIIDIDTSTAHSGHVISVDNTGNNVWTGNIIDVATGTGDAAGDVLKIAIEAGATDVQGIVVTNAAASDQAGWLMNVDASAAWTTNAISFIQSAGTPNADVIGYDNTGNTAWTGDFIGFTSGTGDADGDVMDITVELGATSTQIFDINNAAVSDEAGWLLEVDTTGAWTGNMIDIALGAQASEGNIMNVSMGSTNVAGGVLVVADAGGARTDAIIDITTASTGSAADAAAIFQINSTGDLDNLANVFDINMSGGTGANVIDITTLTAATSGNMIDLNFGAVTDTGDAINIALGVTATGAQALVVTSGAMTRTTDLFSITDSGTSSGDTMEIALTGATTGHGIFLNNDAMVATGNVLYIDSDADRSSTSLFVIDDIADDTASAPTIDINATGATDQPLLNVDASAANGALIDLNHTLADVTVQTYFIRGTYTDTADAEADFLLFEDNAADAQFLIAQDGNTTITGSGDGTAALTLTTGDLVVSDGDLTVSGGDVNFTTDAGDTLNIAKGAAPTADVVLIAGGSPATTNVDALAITLTTTDQTDITNSLLNMVLTSGGTAATDIARGLFIDLASTAGGTDTAIEIENTAAWDTDIELQFDERVVNSTDDMVDFIGGGGADNTDLRIDLDGTRPVISSPTDTIIEIAEDVEISGGNLFLALDNEASRDWALCVAVDDGGATPGTTLQEVDDCDTAAGADYAERYPTDGSAEFGDVMVLGTRAVTLTNNTVIPQLVKSTFPYQRSLVGVVSDNIGQFTSAGYNVPDEESPQSIALVGRVPVKVTDEGGPIVEGDYLTTSSTPGHAMKATKAGPVVGMALGSFDGKSGTVMAFIKAAWYDPIEEQKRAVLAALGMGSYQSLYGQVLGATTAEGSSETATSGTATNALIGPAADGSLGVLAEEVDLLVHGLLTANNLKVTTAAEFGGTLVVKGLATFEGDLVVKGALSLGSLDIAGALTKTMTAGSDISAGDPVAVSGANTVVRAGAGANVVGLAASSAGAGGSVRVAVAGSVGGYSGLATGARYYVGPGGVVTTAPGGDRAVHIGIAISGSEMIVQIFEAAAPPAPPVVDTATVDPGPTVTVDSGAGGSGGSSSDTSSSPTPESSPTPTPEPSPTSAEATVGEPEASPAPSAELSPVPSAEPTPSPTP